MLSVTFAENVNESPVVGVPDVVSVICGGLVSFTSIQRFPPAFSITCTGPEFGPVPLNNLMENVPFAGTAPDIAVKFICILSFEEVLLK